MQVPLSLPATIACSNNAVRSVLGGKLDNVCIFYDRDRHHFSMGLRHRLRHHRRTPCNVSDLAAVVQRYDLDYESRARLFHIFRCN